MQIEITEKVGRYHFSFDGKYLTVHDMKDGQNVVVSTDCVEEIPSLLQGIQKVTTKYKEITK